MVKIKMTVKVMDSQSNCNRIRNWVISSWSTTQEPYHLCIDSHANRLYTYSKSIMCIAHEMWKDFCQVQTDKNYKMQVADRTDMSNTYKTEYTEQHPACHRPIITAMLTTEALISLALSILTVIFQVDPGYPVPECLHSGFFWSKGWWKWCWQL